MRNTHRARRTGTKNKTVEAIVVTSGQFHVNSQRMLNKQITRFGITRKQHKKILIPAKFFQRFVCVYGVETERHTLTCHSSHIKCNSIDRFISFIQFHLSFLFLLVCCCFFLLPFASSLFIPTQCCYMPVLCIQCLACVQRVMKRMILMFMCRYHFKNALQKCILYTLRLTGKRSEN